MIDRKALTVYLLITFGVAWPLFVLPLAFNGAGAAVAQSIRLAAWMAAMWAPGLAALITTRFVQRRPLRSLGLGRLGDRRVYLWAWLVPLLLVVTTGVLTMATGLGRLDLSFGMIRASLAAAGSEAIDPVLIVVIQAAIALTIGPLINSLFALGEELGWRAWLFPALQPLGNRNALAWSGVIWGLWHAPAILQGLNYPSQPVLGVLMMVVMCILLGAILSWLYLRTGSPWAPALGHGAINAMAGLPILFMAQMDYTWAGTVASPVGWIAMALFVGWLVWRGQLPLGAAAQPAGPAIEAGA
jgi:membrane protease YdiL (CAAX protease family)